jgi:hypothetical protein
MANFTGDPWFYGMIRELDALRSYRVSANTRPHPLRSYLALRIVEVLLFLEQRAAL